MKSTDLVWTEVPSIKIVLVNQERFERVTHAEVIKISKLDALRIHKICAKLIRLTTSINCEETSQSSKNLMQKVKEILVMYLPERFVGTSLLEFWDGYRWPHN